ncbi:MAG: adenylate/guanylate cyclase domain-containing protein, partial [Pseudohongiella sp.]|nr:adenylate/guanylate cyclase domain-containing protein [Pseudohongiella sp.]
FRPIDKVRVKGRDQSVMLLTPIANRDVITDLQKHVIASSSHALDAYWQRDFERALILFTAIAHAHAEDDVALLFVQRCQFYLGNPPAPDWDGIWSHSSK